MRGEDGEQVVGEGHRPLAAVLRESDLDGAAGGALHWSPHVQLATQEVHIPEPEACSLADAEPAKAHTAMKATKRSSATSRSRRTCSGVGICIDDSRLR